MNVEEKMLANTAAVVDRVLDPEAKEEKNRAALVDVLETLKPFDKATQQRIITAVGVHFGCISDTPIAWSNVLDDNDNTVWEGPSPYHDEGSPFLWRLRQKLEGDGVVWYADHDAELGGEGEEWRTLNEAKVTCQASHDSILKEAAT